MVTNKRSRLPGLIIPLIFVAIAAAVIFRQQDILDWWALRDYTAPAAVQTLASDTTMNDYSRKIFFVNKPQIQDKAAFYISCEEGETSIVLGCYKPRDGIYVLDVEDARLDGIEQVTAAHEMLHAAYERLSKSQKQVIGKQINDFYATLANEQIKAKVNLYVTNNADITNELHSILGTEVANLSPELETYYQKYFNNRSKIVAFADQYQAVFSDRKNKLAAYDAQLIEIESQVKANNADLDSQQNIITAASQRLDKLLQQNKRDEYNEGVIAYNQQIIPFKELIAETKALIAQYKTILDARNQVAVEAQELNKALDSRIDTTVNTP